MKIIKSITIEKDLAEVFQQIAQKKDRSFSSLVSEVLKKYIITNWKTDARSLEEK